MDQSERAFRKRFYAIVGCGTGVLLVLTWLLIKGIPSPRGFGVAGLIWWIVMFSAIVLLIRASQRLAEELRREQIAKGIPTQTLDRDRCVKSIRSLKGLAALFAALLIYGTFATQGGPLVPRAAGAGFDIFIMTGWVYSIARLPGRLKGLLAGSATASSETD